MPGDRLATFASTASRWSQRIVVSTAVQHQWELFGLDVAQAFLKGLTFEQAAAAEGGASRSVQFRVPPGSVPILQRLEGYADYCPLTEVLDMLRPGFGLKDAPALWARALQLALKEPGWNPTQIDPQLYLKHARQAARLELVGIISAHVDDLKGASTKAEYDAVIAHLTSKFGQLKKMAGSFEHCGFHHVSLAGGGKRLHQAHYARQLNALAEDEIR